MAQAYRETGMRRTGRTTKMLYEAIGHVLHTENTIVIIKFHSYKAARYHWKKITNMAAAISPEFKFNQHGMRVDFECTDSCVYLMGMHISRSAEMDLSRGYEKIVHLSDHLIFETNVGEEAPFFSEPVVVEENDEIVIKISPTNKKIKKMLDNLFG